MYNKSCYILEVIRGLKSNMFSFLKMKKMQRNVAELKEKKTYSIEWRDNLKRVYLHSQDYSQNAALTCVLNEELLQVTTKWEMTPPPPPRDVTEWREGLALNNGGRKLDWFIWHWRTARKIRNKKITGGQIFADKNTSLYLTELIRRDFGFTNYWLFYSKNPSKCFPVLMTIGFKFYLHIFHTLKSLYLLKNLHMNNSSFTFVCLQEIICSVRTLMQKLKVFWETLKRWELLRPTDRKKYKKS